MPRRILFVGESVTLAHVARPASLALALDQESYDIHFACDERYRGLLEHLPFAQHTIQSIPSESFLTALRHGHRVYTTENLRAYVEQERKLLGAVQPDVVVGDFRISLAVSAPLTGVPYMAISNAYWSPYANREFLLPDHMLTRMFGTTAGQFLFDLVRPLVFGYHSLPLNRIRREYGLEPLGFDLCRIYTHGDYTLYADIPGFIPTSKLPHNHCYIGPIFWSPSVSRPEWWNQLPAERPKVYVTLGSSGNIRVLPLVLEALASLPVSVLVATAGREVARSAPKNAFIADYLPGEEAAAIASLVICNGGSPTTQQALAAGTPVLGLPANMDQYMNIAAVKRLGAGEFIRGSNLSVPLLREMVATMLAAGGYKDGATQLAHEFAQYCAGKRFAHLLEEVLTEKALVR